MSLRLKHLASFYSGQSQVWDIGCDHGLLGLSFLEHLEVMEIHLLDPSLPVMKELKKKLIDSYITIPSKIFLHHQKGQELTASLSASKCFFIAGMGGGEIQEILKHLKQILSPQDRLILSPHRKVLELRKYLHEQDWELHHEGVFLEGQQFYPYLVLSYGAPKNKVSSFGDEMWETSTGKMYRDYQIKVYSLHQDSLSKSYREYLKSKVPH